MELVLENHSSFPRIGESAELQLLRRTIAQFEKGEKSAADLAKAEDRMTEVTLKDQIQAGLDIVTDGQVRWHDPISHLAGKLTGVEINGLLRFFDTNFYFRQPVVRARLERTRPLVIKEFEFAKGKSPLPVKAVLTGPLTLARHSIVTNGGAAGSAVGERLAEEYAGALAAEVRALAAAGASIVQIEEPALARHPEDLPLAGRCLQALAAQKGSARLALALYFGDPAPIHDQLQTLPVDILVLDFTYSPNLLEAVVASRTSKTLALGLVDGRNTKLEALADVARQIERAERACAAGPIHLTTSCGLEYLPRDRAILKLKLLARIKETLMGRAG